MVFDFFFLPLDSFGQFELAARSKWLYIHCFYIWGFKDLTQVKTLMLMFFFNQCVILLHTFL